MRKSILLLLLIILLALAFKIPAVLNSQSFWFDEAVSLSIAQHNILASWQYLQWENNPPLHYWLLHYWTSIFGQTEISVRLSSVLFSILGIMALYFLGKKLKNSQTGLFAAFLFAISSYQLHLSMDGRMYAPMLFFGILSSYFFLQVLAGQKKINWFFYVLFTLLTYYTHLTGLFLLISQNLYFFYHYFYLKIKKPKLLSWLYAQIIILALFSPWLISFMLTHFSRFDSTAWYWHTSGEGFFLFQLPRSFFFLAIEVPYIELIALILFFVLFLASFTKIKSFSLAARELRLNFNFSPAIVFLLLLFLTPIFLGFLLQVWVVKYYSIASIGCYLTLAYGFSNLKLKVKYLVSLVVIIIIFLLPYNLFFIQQYHHKWHKVARYIESVEQPADKILVAAFVYQLPFDYYYHGKLEVVGYKPAGIEDDLLLSAVKYNWYPVLTKENMPDINQILGNKKRAIVISPCVAGTIHNANLVLDWFSAHNWPLTDQEQFGGFERPSVYIFTNPN